MRARAGSGLPFLYAGSLASFGLGIWIAQAARPGDAWVDLLTNIYLLAMIPLLISTAYILVLAIRWLLWIAWRSRAHPLHLVGIIVVGLIWLVLLVVAVPKLEPQDARAGQFGYLVVSLIALGSVFRAKSRHGRGY